MQRFELPEIGRDGACHEILLNQSPCSAMAVSRSAKITPDCPILSVHLRMHRGRIASEPDSRTGTTRLRPEIPLSLKPIERPSLAVDEGSAKCKRRKPVHLQTAEIGPAPFLVCSLRHRQGFVLSHAANRASRIQGASDFAAESASTLSRENPVRVASGVNVGAIIRPTLPSRAESGDSVQRHIPAGVLWQSAR